LHPVSGVIKLRPIPGGEVQMAHQRVCHPEELAGPGTWPYPRPVLQGHYLGGRIVQTRQTVSIVARP